MQESKLYYDADLGCFYQYDYESKKYTVHSRVKLPDTDMTMDEGEKKSKQVVEISSSDDEFSCEEEHECWFRLP